MPATTQGIITPRACIDMLLRNQSTRNPSVCTKIGYKGFEISIAMDSSHTNGDLFRADIRIYDKNDADVTFAVMPEYEDCGVIPGSGEALRDIFQAIDELVTEPA